MALLTGRNGAFLLLAVLIAAVAITAVWATMAAANGGGAHSDTEPTAGPDDDLDVFYEGPSGIHVSGTGKATAAPDIAVAFLGVEAEADTAAEARASAAKAMTDVIKALKAAGVAEKDIQTRHFNISPRYQHVEIERCDDEGDDSASAEGKQESILGLTCYTAWENRLMGYSVSNQATVKVRNLSKAGSIVDKVAESAGDLIRINGINFQIEDSQALEDKARKNAVDDLFRKAEMLADLSGVKLGGLVYLSEAAPYSPPQPLYARAEAAMADSASVITPIASGELEVTTTLQGVFLIAGKADPTPTATPRPTRTPRATATPKATSQSGSR